MWPRELFQGHVHLFIIINKALIFLAALIGRLLVVVLQAYANSIQHLQMPFEAIVDDGRHTNDEGRQMITNAGSP